MPLEFICENDIKWFPGIDGLPKAPALTDFIYPVNINRQPRRVIGWHQSQLNNASNPFHSELERQAMMLLDLVPSVARFSSQSERIPYDFGIRECLYTPDIRAELASGRPLYIEVKPLAYYRLVENAERTIAINAAIRTMGASFRILSDKCLSVEPRKGNVEWLQIYRAIEPDPKTHHMIRLFLSQVGVSTVGELSRLCPDRSLGNETVMSLVLRRHLLIDLNTVLNDDTLVRPARRTIQ